MTNPIIALTIESSSKIYSRAMEETHNFEVANNKVKFLGDTCGAFEPKFQKVKKNNKGYYITLQTEKWYLDYPSQCELSNLIIF